MAKYARFMMKRCGKRGLMAQSLGLKGPYKRYAVNAGQSYGEWAEPAGVYPNRWTDMIAPRPGGKFTSASLSYDSVYGTASCGWCRECDKITYTVTVPANTTAELSLPGGLTKEWTAGAYSFGEII